ncbi:MAG: hypothetical protein FWH27_12270, partial [Planctomycetaceae bacterium]|nr:hypothetical protein [Planctomycetaceae bacterium]
MLSNVGIICFAASYALALLLEVSRFFFRSGFRGALMFGFAAAGWIAHSAYLYHKIAFHNGSLFDSVQGWLFVVAWVIAALYLYLVVYFPRTPFGMFLLPLSLASIRVGVHFADASPFPADTAGQTWRIVHGVSFLLVTVTVFLGFVTGMMYLVQASNLKHKRPMLGHRRLPTLEWLQTTNARLIGLLIVLLAVGILSGLAINVLNLRQHRVSVSLFDPMVLVTMLMFLFLLLFVATVKKWPPAREGQRLAIVTLICFVALVVILTFGLLLPGHWHMSRPLPAETSPTP